VGAIDHRFALNMPALMSAPSKKSFSSASTPILGSSPRTSLGVKHFQIHRWRNARSLGSEKPGRSFEQLRLPGRDLVGMHIENLRQFRQRLLALQRGQRHLRLESRCVVPEWSSGHNLS
jgi:hypothetical protein